MTSLQLVYSPPVPPRGENRFWQELERRLGVTFEPAFVPAGSYEERFATTIAGSDLPDLMLVGFETPTLGQLIQQGAFADLTEYLTGDALAEYPNLAAFDPQIWRNVAVNGRIYGVPRPRTRVGPILGFRQDWAERLGIPRPRDAAEFRRLMEGFTRSDPDGNGRADTWGLGSQDGGLNLGWFVQVFRGPNGWRREPDGGLPSLYETDEYRAAVAYARDLWAAGTYHPDAAAMTNAQMKDGLNSGGFGASQIGLLGLPGSAGFRARAKQFSAPTAEVVGLVPPGHDGGQAVTHNSLGFFGSTTIPAGRDEARVRELLRILDYFAAPFGSEERIFLDYGLEGVHHTVEPDGNRVRTDLGRTELSGEVRSDLSNLTNEPPVFYFDIPGDAAYLQELTMDTLAIGIDNPTVGLYSPTAAERGVVLGQLVADTELAIVTGAESLDALDRMVAEWRSRGGDQIREEFQEALAAR